MKTNFLAVISKFIALMLLLVLVTFCKKETNDSKTSSIIDENTLTLKSIGWEVTFSAGHNQCYVGCFCAAPGLNPCVHIPCWSYGKNYTHTIGISIFKNSNLFELENLDEPFNIEVMLKDENADSEFPFPARSFSYIKDNVQYWLNVPYQNVQTTNNTDDVFTLKNIYFSKTKAFDNL